MSDVAQDPQQVLCQGSLARGDHARDHRTGECSKHGEPGIGDRPGLGLGGRDAQHRVRHLGSSAEQRHRSRGCARQRQDAHRAGSVRMSTTSAKASGMRWAPRRERSSSSRASSTTPSRIGHCQALRLSAPGALGVGTTTDATPGRPTAAVRPPSEWCSPPGQGAREAAHDPPLHPGDMRAPGRSARAATPRPVVRTEAESAENPPQAWRQGPSTSGTPGLGGLGGPSREL